MRMSGIVLALLVALLTAFAATTAHADDRQGLFINLTTDDTWSASKAIFFAHHRVLKSGYEPVAIWLNVRGIYLADKKRASAARWPAQHCSRITCRATTVPISPNATARRA